MTLKKKNPIKIIITIFLTLIGIIAIFLLSVFVVHKILIHNEIKMLDEQGYVNSVSVGDYNLNVCIYGKNDGKHTIVAMSGKGVNDYSVYIKKVTDAVANDNKIVIVDRAGYGLSDDTMEPQTIEQIVENYRTALKNAGCEAPYVLLPHSLGGMYATYWENLYPDEIEAVLFCDTSELVEGGSFEEDSESLFEVIACKIGLQRLVYNNIIMPPPPTTDEKTREIIKALNCYNTYTYAQLSESELINDNYQKAYESIKKNDIPKIYISASSSFKTEEELREYFNYVNEKMKSAGQEAPYDMNDEEFHKLAKTFLDACSDWKNTQIMPYIEKLGNCKYVRIPGDHMIYEQKPDEVAKILQELIESLDK